MGRFLLCQMKPKSIEYFDYLWEDENPTLKFREGLEAPVINRVREGLDMDEFLALQEMLEVTEERLAGLLGMSRATLHRRKKVRRLDRTESDRLVRYARLLSHAAAALGGLDGARRWMTTPAIAFGGELPLDYADTEIGAREVDSLLGRIEHGVFS